MKKEALSESVLTKLFTPSKSNLDYIHGRESTSIEYKESYNHSGMAQYFKTMAAFANAEGGYIIFGIGDSPRIFLGLNEKSKKQFESIKVEEFTRYLNEYFQPEIQWGHVVFEYREKSYGIIYTSPLINKPCICSKMYDDKNKKYSLEEGDIYYRYRGRSQKIRYAELRNIFDQAAEREAMKWRRLIEHTAKIGISNASLLNMNNGELGIDNSVIVMDKALVNQIKFIKEGSFVEKDGDPTLRLMGSASNIEAFDGIVVTAQKLRAIEQEDIVKAFLKNSEVEAPFEFIKVILNSSSGFQPIYYYIRQSKSSVQDVIDYIESSHKSSQTIKLLLERLKGKRVEQQLFKKNETEASKNKIRYKELWEQQRVQDIKLELEEKKNENWFLQSFFLIDDNHIKSSSEYYKEVLLELYEERYKHLKGIDASNFRKVLCRLDEAIYF